MVVRIVKVMLMVNCATFKVNTSNFVCKCARVFVVFFNKVAILSVILMDVETRHFNQYRRVIFKCLVAPVVWNKNEVGNDSSEISVKS